MRFSGDIRVAAIVGLIVAVALSLAACGSEGAEVGESGGETPETVRGMVLEVEAESLISLKWLEVQDGDGVVWRFEGRGKVVPGFTPSHLNEHKLLGQSVEVAFYREGDALVLQDITD